MDTNETTDNSSMDIDKTGELSDDYNGSSGDPKDQDRISTNNVQDDAEVDDDILSRALDEAENQYREKQSDDDTITKDKKKTIESYSDESDNNDNNSDPESMPGLVRASDFSDSDNTSDADTGDESDDNDSMPPLESDDESENDNKSENDNESNSNHKSNRNLKSSNKHKSHDDYRKLESNHELDENDDSHDEDVSDVPDLVRSSTDSSDSDCSSLSTDSSEEEEDDDEKDENIWNLLDSSSDDSDSDLDCEDSTYAVEEWFCYQCGVFTTVKNTTSSTKDNSKKKKTKRKEGNKSKRAKRQRRQSGTEPKNTKRKEKRMKDEKEKEKEKTVGMELDDNEKGIATEGETLKSSLQETRSTKESSHDSTQDSTKESSHDATQDSGSSSGSGQQQETPLCSICGSSFVEVRTRRLEAETNGHRFQNTNWDSDEDSSSSDDSDMEYGSRGGNSSSVYSGNSAFIHNYMRRVRRERNASRRRGSNSSGANSVEEHIIFNGPGGGQFIVSRGGGDGSLPPGLNVPGTVSGPNMLQQILMMAMNGAGAQMMPMFANAGDYMNDPEQFQNLLNMLLGEESNAPPPASKDALSTLQSGTAEELGAIINEKEKSDASSSEGSSSVQETNRACAICLEKFAEDPSITCCKMPCKHIFHKNCLTKWLEMHRTCPCCRYELMTESEKEKAEMDEAEEAN